MCGRRVFEPVYYLQGKANLIATKTALQIMDGAQRTPKHAGLTLSREVKLKAP